MLVVAGVLFLEGIAQQHRLCWCQFAAFHQGAEEAQAVPVLVVVGVGQDLG
ncbi:MAG: hypothetical protein AB8H12_10120 [Lewinella sp.]